MLQVLGYLEASNKDKGWAGRYEIVEGQDILIGRDAKSCDLVLTDPTISNRHLLIYSIIYDPDDPTVQPFVYAEDLSLNGFEWLPKKWTTTESYFTRKGNAFLLSNGDKLQLRDGSSFVFYTVPTVQALSQLEISENEATERDAFSTYFTITDRQLGGGASGRVLMALDHMERRQLACKIINLASLSQDSPNRGRLWREVELLSKTSHPNIMKVHQVFHTESTIYIIEDLIAGGDLASYINQRGGRLENDDACAITYQITKALQYLHKQSIVHRDLKPENVLLSSPNPGARAILTDFGQAIKPVVGKGTKSKRMQTMCGTLDWVAPEVQGRNTAVSKAGYTKSVDMWSLGCLTTALLNGTSFFVNTQDSTYRRDSKAAIVEASGNCDLTRLDSDISWNIVQPEAKEFVKALLRLDENVRMSAEEALEHQWFTKGHRKSFFEVAYEEATKGWTRTSSPADLVENLSSWIQFKQESRLFQSKNKEPFQCSPPKHLQENPSPTMHRSHLPVAVLEEKAAPSSRKRRQSTYLSASDPAIYMEAGKENCGFISAKTYGQTVAKKRMLHEKRS